MVKEEKCNVLWLQSEADLRTTEVLIGSRGNIYDLQKRYYGDKSKSLVSHYQVNVIFLSFFQFILTGFVFSWSPRSLQSQPPGGAPSSFLVISIMSLKLWNHEGPGSNGPCYLPTALLMLPLRRR